MLFASARKLPIELLTCSTAVFLLIWISTSELIFGNLRNHYTYILRVLHSTNFSMFWVITLEKLP